MKLQDQVCPAELAERLKELGVSQESLFYHTHSEKWGVMYKTSIDFSGNPTSAFTVAELGVMLPEYVHNGELDWFLEMYKDSSNGMGEEWFLVRYMCINPVIGLNMKSEAECRAAMLIYLLENKLATAEQINQRLKE